MKIHTYKNWQYWYDRAYRCWFAIRVDSNGNQVGDCIDAYDKDGILKGIEIGSCCWVGEG